jgi:hypothetical protein
MEIRRICATSPVVCRRHIEWRKTIDDMTNDKVSPPSWFSDSLSLLLDCSLIKLPKSRPQRIQTLEFGRIALKALHPLHEDAPSATGKKPKQYRTCHRDAAPGK